MWSMSTWGAAVSVLSSYGLNQVPNTARHCSSRTTSWPSQSGRAGRSSDGTTSVSGLAQEIEGLRAPTGPRGHPRAGGTTAPPTACQRVTQRDHLMFRWYVDCLKL